MPISPPSLSDLIDEAVVWFARWNRNLLRTPGFEQEDPFLPRYDLWRDNTELPFPSNQPAIERLTELRDHLETLSRLVLLKGRESSALDTHDYNLFSEGFLNFIAEARRLERALAEAASGLDPLTGLRSRIGLFEELRREQSRFVRGGRPFCVSIMDLDHFKNVNDTYGHAIGDKVLSSIANHVTRMLRLSDDAYRFGGEEFLLCLKDADEETGSMVLERLRASLERAPLQLSDGTLLKVTASFGVSVSEKNLAIEDLVSKADQALYEAKTSGRNKVVCAPMESA